jgi:SNF2 family DNA or RNA helicase
MRLWVYQGDKHITRFEQFGIHALGLHRFGTPTSELDPEHRRLTQNLLRFSNLNSSEGYFFIPQKHVAFFLPKLARFHQVQFRETDEPVKFSEHALMPLVFLKEQGPNKVSLEASFRDTEAGEEFAFSQARVFIGRRSWVVVKKVVYPIKSSPLVSLLEDFEEEGRLILYGSEAADFIQNYLPLLSKKPEVVLPENFTVPEVLQTAGEAVYQISEDKESEKLILTIDFSYGGNMISPHVHDEDVMVEVKKGDKTILVRRDLNYEKKVLQEFHEQGFRRVTASRFETAGEDALDFLSDGLTELKEKSLVTGEEDLEDLRLFGELGEAQVKARAVSSGIDWLEIEVGFEIDGIEIPYEVVQALAAKNQHYLKVPGKGFVKINLEQFSKIEEKIAELEGEMDSKGNLKLSQYHAAYLDEILRVDWSRNQDLGNMIRSLRETAQIPKRPLPERLETVLREYQHHGYDWMNFLREHNFHGILADDMGLGKTVQALAYLQDRKNTFGPKPNLVLAPTSVVFNWANEVRKFTPEMNVLVLMGPERKALYKQIASSDVVISSYAVFRRDVKALTALEWRTVILDEAQNIKNYRSKTALLVKELKAEQRWALTGTPLENRLSELWSIFDYLMPGFLGSYPHFKRKYQQPIEAHQSKEHLERLRKRIYPFILRRLKDEVASELPPKTEVTNYCEMTGEQRKLYQEVMAACRRQVFADVEKKGLERSHVSILTALLRLRQACCHPELLGPSFGKRNILSGKMEAFKELVTEVIDEGHRILVFSQFVEMLSLLRNWLEEAEIPYEYLDGRTRRREERVRRFNEDAAIPVFLVSLRAGGTGLNLTGASYVIHYDPWWNPAVQDQATDRAHRIGQTKHVFSYKLITKDSVEEKILLLQERKRSLARDLLSADSALGKQLSYEDLEYLFS